MGFVLALGRKRDAQREEGCESAEDEDRFHLDVASYIFSYGFSPVEIDRTEPMPDTTGAASRTILYYRYSLRILRTGVVRPNISAVTPHTCEATLILYDACLGRRLARLLGIHLWSPGLMDLRIFVSQMTFRFRS
jgi:hypothetical protein